MFSISLLWNDREKITMKKQPWKKTAKKLPSKRPCGLVIDFEIMRANMYGKMMNSALKKDSSCKVAWFKLAAVIIVWKYRNLSWSWDNLINFRMLCHCIAEFSKHFQKTSNLKANTKKLFVSTTRKNLWLASIITFERYWPCSIDPAFRHCLQIFMSVYCTKVTKKSASFKEKHDCKNKFDLLLNSGNRDFYLTYFR